MAVLAVLLTHNTGIYSGRAVSKEKVTFARLQFRTVRGGFRVRRNHSLPESTSLALRTQLKAWRRRANTGVPRS